MDIGKSDNKAFLRCTLPQCKGLRFSIYHKFPRNSKRFQLWLNAFDNPVLNAIPHERLVRHVVCCRHFRVCDYIHPESCRLNLVAVPNLNLKELNELDKCRHAATEKIEYQEYQETSLSPKNIGKAAVEKTDKATTNCEQSKATRELEVINDDMDDVATVCIEEHSDSIQLVVKEDTIQIKDMQLQSIIEVDILWLRYTCSCSQCYDEIEKKSLINFLELDNDMKPVVVSLKMEIKSLHIIWIDGHNSQYSLHDLYEKLKKTEELPEGSKRLNWTFRHTEYRDDLQPISWNELMQSKTAVNYRALDRLEKSGVLIINNIPKCDKDSLLKKFVITKLFNQSWNHFTTEKRNVFPNDSTPFSNCTFESFDKALQILTVPNDKEHLKLKLVLVDGFTVTEQLDKSTYTFLTGNQMIYNFRNAEGYKYIVKQPVISNDYKAERIFFSNLHINKINSNDFRKVFKCLKDFNDIAQMPEVQWPVELNTETIIILNNYRIMWCLKEPPKDCELECVYLERKHYLSSLNSFNNISE